MKRVSIFVFALLFVALYIYFLGTPWLASLTGFSPRAISLTAGFAIVMLGITSVMIVRLTAERERGN